MSHSHEPSYYEIALTNRQVLVVFVVLLICVIAAFFAGVWVGQSDSGAVAVANLDGKEEPAVETSNEPVDELHFFSSEGNKSPGGGDPASELQGDASPETTLLEDLAGETQNREEQVAGGSATAEVEQESGPLPQSPPPVIVDGHVVQVFSSTDEAQAKRLLQQLSNGGFPAFLSPVDVSGQTMHRVRIGPYGDLKEAESVARQVRRAYKLDTWVTR